MCGAHSAKSSLKKGEDFLHPMAQLQTRQLKLAGQMAHIFAGGVSKYTPRCASSLALACER